MRPLRAIARWLGVLALAGCVRAAPTAGPDVAARPRPSPTHAAPASTPPSYAPAPATGLAAIARIHHARPYLRALGDGSYQLTFLFFTAADGDPVLFGHQPIAITYAFLADRPDGALLGSGTLSLGTDAQIFSFRPTAPLGTAGVRCRFHVRLPDARSLDDDTIVSVSP